MNDSALLLKKKKIADQFSKKVSCYDEKAHLQLRCGKSMMHYLLQHHSYIEGPILEIGCGTGFVTEEILRAFPGTNYCVTDLSEKMLDACRKKLRALKLPLDSVSFEVLDGECIEGAAEYELIISSMVFQWFHDFETSLKALVQRLKPGGTLAFCVPTADSFWQWREICQHMNLPFTGNQLPQIEQVARIAKKLSLEMVVREESSINFYPSAIDFFRSLKSIGAATSLTKQQLKPHEMGRLIQHWNAQCQERISCTYRIAYFLLIRS